MNSLIIKGRVIGFSMFKYRIIWVALVENYAKKPIAKLATFSFRDYILKIFELQIKLVKRITTNFGCG